MKAATKTLRRALLRSGQAHQRSRAWCSSATAPLARALRAGAGAWRAGKQRCSCGLSERILQRRARSAGGEASMPGLHRPCRTRARRLFVALLPQRRCTAGGCTMPSLHSPRCSSSSIRALSIASAGHARRTLRVGCRRRCPAPASSRLRAGASSSLLDEGANQFAASSRPTKMRPSFDDEALAAAAHHSSDGCEWSKQRARPMAGRGFAGALEPGRGEDRWDGAPWRRLWRHARCRSASKVRPTSTDLGQRCAPCAAPLQRGRSLPRLGGRWALHPPPQRPSRGCAPHHSPPPALPNVASLAP
jgi:hypothetical protein